MAEKVCFGFEVHQPYTLNMDFEYKNSNHYKNLNELYFNSSNKELIKNISLDSYEPATEIILENLDNGFKCAFGISGIVVKQLDQWAPYALDLFKDVAKHKNSEFLGQTYYHSLSSLYSNINEFKDQIRLHKNMLKEEFKVRPEIFMNTDLIFNNRIASTVYKLGFKGIYAEEVPKLIDENEVNYLHECQKIPILIRNQSLSDDIAFRLTDCKWDMYPLDVKTYAKWLSSATGDCINLFLNYKSFNSKSLEYNTLDFISNITDACNEIGIECVLPSDVISNKPIKSINVYENNSTSWCGDLKNTNAWLGNDVQKAAFKAIQRNHRWLKSKKLKNADIWRNLQVSDNFYLMGNHSNTNSFNFFKTFMKILSHYEKTCIAQAKESNIYAGILRSRTHEEAFYFNFKNNEYFAHNLDEFEEIIRFIPDSALTSYLERGDFFNWIKNILGDEMLSTEIEKCKSPKEFKIAVRNRKFKLWKNIHTKQLHLN